MGKREGKRDKRDKRRKYREITPPPSKIPPTRKLSQGTVFTASLKIVVMNVYRWFRRNDHAVSEAAELTASCTGVSRSSVFQFRKEETSPQGLKDRKMTRVRKKLAANSRDVKYDEKARLAIKSAVYDLKSRNITASLNNILEQYKMHEDLPSLTANTLRRLLHDMGFIYKKEGNKHILIEKTADSEKKIAKTKEKKTAVVRKKMVKKTQKPIDDNLVTNPDFDANMFDSPQYPKTEYMFFHAENNKDMQQTQHQHQLPQLPQLQPQIQADAHSLIQHANLHNSLIRQMPPPILPTTIHDRDMQIAPASKLMMLSSAQNTVPWT